MKSRNVYVDVENTISVPFLTGIQRTIKELLTQLWELDSEQFRFIPVCYCDICGGWVIVSKNRIVFGNNTAKQKSIFSSVKSKISNSDSANIIKFFYSIISQAHKRLIHKNADHKNSLLPKFESGSIFLDMDSSWHNSLSRNTLLPALKNSNVRVCTLHYDLIPILMPEVVHPNTINVFKCHLDAHIAHSSLFICISQNTKNNLQQYLRQTNKLRPEVGISSLRLGDNLLGNPILPVPNLKLPEELVDKKYVLCVGTIEPRKNHKLLISVFNELSNGYPEVCLVFVGRGGWMSDSIIEQIKDHPLYDKRLFWLSKVDDSTLVQLYRNSFAVVLASKYEGFGLPLTEALNQGCLCLSSNAGALPEAGQDWAKYFDPTIPSELSNLIEYYLQNTESYNRQKSFISNRPSFSWRNTAEQFVYILAKSKL